MPRRWILRALCALVVAITAAPALAADSTAIALPDVPWQKPWARQADVATTATDVAGMPVCPSGKVLTKTASGTYSCVSAGSSGGSGCSGTFSYCVITSCSTLGYAIDTTGCNMGQSLSCVTGC